MMIEDGFLAVGPFAVGALFEFVLFDAQGKPDLEDFSTANGHPANVVLRVVRPVFEHIAQVNLHVHNSPTLRGFRREINWRLFALELRRDNGAGIPNHRPWSKCKSATFIEQNP
jgi:hypothetical protein